VIARRGITATLQGTIIIALILTGQKLMIQIFLNNKYIMDQQKMQFIEVETGEDVLKIPSIPTAVLIKNCPTTQLST